MPASTDGERISDARFRDSGHPVRIQTDNSTAVAYLNHQELCGSQRGLEWVEISVPTLLAVHILGIELGHTVPKLRNLGFRSSNWRWTCASHLDHKLPVYMSEPRFYNLEGFPFGHPGNAKGP